MSYNIISYNKRLPKYRKREKLTNCHDRSRQASFLTVPQYFGPGMWYSLHEMAYMADNGEISRDSFLDYVKMLSIKFPCKKCRTHFAKMLDSHPIPGDDLFGWTVDRHNEVNTRLNRYVPPNYRCIYTKEEALDKLKSIEAGIIDNKPCTDCNN